MQLGLPSDYWRDNSVRPPLPDPVATRLDDKTSELRNRVMAASMPVIDNNPTSFGANGVGNDPATGAPPVTDGLVQLARNDLLPCVGRIPNSQPALVVLDNNRATVG
jgi:hypothetical protein